MFWADIIAKDIKSLKNYKSHLVNDAKTPSGKVHSGALRGVLIHDLVHKSLLKQGVKSRYTYHIDDFDPMDSLPASLPKVGYEKYMGVPLKDIPAPEGSGSYAEYYANDFISVFTKLGAKPEIIWSSQMYKSGKFDKAIKIALDNGAEIQTIYHNISGSSKQKDWLPFSPVCPECGKIGTTRTNSWDGKEVGFTCELEMVTWAKGCGFTGKISPFGGTGKMPYKVEWPAKWYSLGVTVEGEGKDHSSKGGTRDVSGHIAKEIFKIEPPHDLPYEFFLFGGRKMSSSKGVGVSALEVSEILPPEVLRFLMARTQIKSAIDFDPAQPHTVPNLFDEYDRGQKAFFEGGNDDLARTWEASQVEKPNNNFAFRFSQIVNFVQIPGIDLEKEAESSKGSKLNREDREYLKQRARYAEIWLDKFAPSEVKFSVSETLPEESKKLNDLQKKFLGKLREKIRESKDLEDFQNTIYELGKTTGLDSRDTFKAIYTSLLGKDHGPKAASLILALDSGFVKKRFEEVLNG